MIIGERKAEFFHLAKSTFKFLGKVYVLLVCMEFWVWLFTGKLEPLVIIGGIIIILTLIQVLILLRAAAIDIGIGLCFCRFRAPKEALELIFITREGQRRTTHLCAKHRQSCRISGSTKTALLLQRETMPFQPFYTKPSLH